MVLCSVRPYALRPDFEFSLSQLSLAHGEIALKLRIRDEGLQLSIPFCMRGDTWDVHKFFRILKPLSSPPRRHPLSITLKDFFPQLHNIATIHSVLFIRDIVKA